MALPFGTTAALSALFNLAPTYSPSTIHGRIPNHDVLEMQVEPEIGHYFAWSGRRTADLVVAWFAIGTFGVIGMLAKHCFYAYGLCRERNMAISL